MNLTCTLKRVRFGATSDLNFFEAKNWATWRQWVNTKEWLSSIDSGPRANFNMPVSFHKHISSEKSTLMIGLGLYKFGCQNVPVSSRLLYCATATTCTVLQPLHVLVYSHYMYCTSLQPLHVLCYSHYMYCTTATTCTVELLQMNFVCSESFTGKDILFLSDFSFWLVT